MRGSFSSTLLVLAFGAAGAGEPAIDDRAAFRVAVRTPGSVSDQAWNGEAYRGLLAVRDSMGASISHIQTRTPAYFDQNVRECGRQSYDLVIGHGFEHKDAPERIAPLFPGTVFLVTSSEASGLNVAGIRFTFAQPAYPAGIAAAARFFINVADLIDTEVRQRLDSAWKELESGAWRSSGFWTARDL